MRHKDRLRSGRPQWPDGDWEGPDGALPPPPWPHYRWRGGHGQPSGERLFFRFAFVFGLLVFLGVGVLVTLAAVAFLFFRPGSPHQGRPFASIMPLLGFAVLLVLALRLVRRPGSQARYHASERYHEGRRLPGRRRPVGPGTGRAAAASSATWPIPSTAWPARSRPPTGSAASCWPTSPTSCAPR